MLGRLLKYEIKATARIFLPLYLLLFLFAGINRIFAIFYQNSVFMNISSGVLGFIYGALIFAIFVVTLLVMIQRFHKNLLGDEGYLMFTLPTNAWQHILSKLLVSMMWCILSLLVAIFSVFILLANGALFDSFVKFFTDFLPHLSQYMTGEMVLFVIEVFANLLFTLPFAILTIYTAIAIGHQFSRHRLLASFGAYILISTIYQIIYSIGVISIGNALPAGLLDNPSFAHLFFCGNLLFLVVISAGCFILTNYLLSRRLNLD